MRDHNDNVVIVCSIENVDPMGVHTGDSRHRRAAADAHRPPLPAPARPGDRGHPRGRRRDRRLQRAVRGQPGDRGDPRHRDEPARVALRARWPRRRPASRSPRSPRGSPSATRWRRSPTTSPRLTPASFEPTIDYVVVKWPRFAFEKFPGVDAELSTHMKSRRRGDGDRAHLPAGVRQGDAQARARRRRASLGAPTTDAAGRGSSAPRPDRYDVLLEALRARRRRRARSTRARSIDPWFLRELRALAPDPDAAFAGERCYKCGRHLRGRVRGRARRTTTRAGSGRRRATRSSAATARGGDPRLRAQPHRPGDRVRLLLRARGDDRARLRPRRGDGQLQPRDGLDRLRHLRPPVLRAADARGRARRRRGRAAGGRDRPVRRPDAAEARRRAARPPASRCSAPASTRSTSPRTAGASARCSTGWATRRRPTPPRTRRARRWRRAASVGFPLLVRPSYVLGGRAMEIVYYDERPRGLPARDRAATGARSSSTASWRTRSRSTSTRSATARTSWIGGIMQHVEEAGIHSGDCACVLPPHSLGHEMLDEIRERDARRSRSGSASSG